MQGNGSAGATVSVRVGVNRHRYGHRHPNRHPKMTNGSSTNQCPPPHQPRQTTTRPTHRHTRPPTWSVYLGRCRLPGIWGARHTWQRINQQCLPHPGNMAGGVQSQRCMPLLTHAVRCVYACGTPTGPIPVRSPYRAAPASNAHPPRNGPAIIGQGDCPGLGQGVGWLSRVLTGCVPDTPERCR